MTLLNVKLDESAKRVTCFTMLNENNKILRSIKILSDFFYVVKTRIVDKTLGNFYMSCFKHRENFYRILSDLTRFLTKLQRCVIC